LESILKPDRLNKIAPMPTQKTGSYGNRSANSHDDEYWERLRKQFQTCQHDHAGAYCEYRTGNPGSIEKIAREIEVNEDIIQSDKFKLMKANGSFGVRASDRLLRAGNVYGSRR
jgi:hypothetical protein